MLEAGHQPSERAAAANGLENGAVLQAQIEQPGQVVTAPLTIHEAFRHAEHAAAEDTPQGTVGVEQSQLR